MATRCSHVKLRCFLNEFEVSPESKCAVSNRRDTFFALGYCGGLNVFALGKGVVHQLSETPSIVVPAGCAHSAMRARDASKRPTAGTQ